VQETLAIGNIRLHALTDAEKDDERTLEQVFPGVPPEAWAPYRQRYPAAFGSGNAWHVRYGCYLLHTPEAVILVDAGVGPHGSPIAGWLGVDGKLLEQMASFDIRPADVDVVLFTHLHIDHVGWALSEHGPAPRLTFPRARYLVHQVDWAHFQRAEVKQRFRFPYVDPAITPLALLGGLELIPAEYTVASGVSTIHTPGHTPGHLSILVESGGQQAVILGDIAHHPAQVSEPDWNSMFDMDPEQARQTRHAFLARLEADGMPVAADHFPGTGFGRVVREQAGRVWQPL
jgi:glyoxylase-like metal-dependent hydrolase (beta-lactamase superfamily II)